MLSRFVRQSYNTYTPAVTTEFCTKITRLKKYIPIPDNALDKHYMYDGRGLFIIEKQISFIHSVYLKTNITITIKHICFNLNT